VSTETPGLADDDSDGDDEAVFDDLARRAGAALRRPAPDDGVRVIAARQRRRQALRASVAGGVAVGTLIGTLVIIANRDDPESLPPVDSSPVTVPATRPVTTTPASSTTPSSSTTPTAPPTTIPAGQTQLFTEVAPDTMVTLPRAPADAPRWPSAVWSGTEMIAWGVTPAGVGGAAFNPATGTWRMTAPAPVDGRMWPTTVWTGTEMIAWGGNPFGGWRTDGAAYDPSTDTWRQLPDAPLGPGSPVAVWTGDEVVIIGAYHVGETPPADASSLARATAAAAYDPATDRWRALADLPGRTDQAVWTGTTILATVDLAVAGGDQIESLARYDVGTDTWDIVDENSYTALVGLLDGDGAATTVLALPSDNGAPVAVLDHAGNSIGTLPGIPADPDTFGDRLSAVGVWAGEEALLWIHGGDTVFIDGDPFEGWALNPTTETWRPLPGNDLIPPQIGYSSRALVAAGDVVIAWDGADVARGVAYRAPVTATG
jgi:hypothetical protein